MMIDGIQGREEDVLYFPTLSGSEIAVHPNIFHQIMDTVPASGWQVMQTDEGVKILLSVVHGEFAEEALLSTLRQALKAQRVIDPPLMIQKVDTIPKTASGKAPLIKSNRAHHSDDPLRQVAEALGRAEDCG